MEDYNVCLINDSFPPEIDGVANAVTNYAKIISEKHGRVTVVTPDHPEADDSEFAFPVVRYPSIDMTGAVGYRAGLPFSAETLSRLSDGGFGIIHSHCPITSTMLARLLRERINVPVVMTYHTKFDIDIANAVRGKLLQQKATELLAANIAACDEVWTVSRGAGENLRKIGYEGDYIVMPNGVDFPKGRVDDAFVAEVCGGYELPAGVPVFLFVGRMMWYKGIKIILDALAALKAENTDYRMVFIGGGGDAEEITRYSDKLGLGDRVLFLPPIHDRSVIRAWYCRADLFLFPSTFDTNGLVVREAAACALGSVLVAGSCAAEDVTDGTDSFLIEENTESMASKLKEVCREPESMKRIGENAQRNIYISWESAVDNAYKRYGAVIDNYRRGLYSTHETVSDGVFSDISEMLDAFSRSRQLTREYSEELKSGYNSFLEDISSEENRILSDIDGERKRLIGEIRSREKKMNRKLDELALFIERFM